MRDLVGAAALLASIVTVGSVHAEPTPDPRAAEAEACFEAAEAAQPLMKQRKLREAQGKLAVCARDVCPRAARTDCQAWLDDVMRALPTVVLAAREERAGGTSRADGVRASIDGGDVVVARLDDTPFALDPGAHVVRFERDGFDPIERRIELREGEKDRRVEVVFRPRAAESTAAPPKLVVDTTASPDDRPAVPLRADPTPSYVLAGIGLVGLGFGAYFEAKGLSDRAHLVDTCKATRTCAQSDVDAARMRVTIGDVTLGASAVVLATAAYLYLSRGPAAPEPRAARLSFDLRALPGGAAVGVAGRLW